MNLQSCLSKPLIQDCEFKMADPRWSVKMLKLLKTRFLPETFHAGVFGVADYKSSVIIKEFFNPLCQIILNIIIPKFSVT